MTKSETLDWLRRTPISAPAAGALEELIVGGVPEEAVEQLQRFRLSPLVENRLVAVSILSNYCGACDLEADAISLMARGFLSGDSDIYFAALGVLGHMKLQGDRSASLVWDALRLDPVVAEALQLDPIRLEGKPAN